MAAQAATSRGSKQATGSQASHVGDVVMGSAETPPRLVLLFSGKRKSGKDYVSERLVRALPAGSAVIIRLSGPLKEAYAREHGLQFERLLDASDYKERYRLDMVAWGKRRREADPGFFCRLAIEMYGAHGYPLWVVSDARRPSDIEFFQSNYPHVTKLCRVYASTAARVARGWVFTKGVDDADTECALDDFHRWDIKIHNDGTNEAVDSSFGFEELLSPCISLAQNALLPA